MRDRDVGGGSELPGREAVDFAVDLHFTAVGFLDLSLGHLSGTDLADRVVAQIAMQTVEFESFAVLPGQQRNGFFGKEAGDMSLDVDPVGTEIDVVFPG